MDILHKDRAFQGILQDLDERIISEEKETCSPAALTVKMVFIDKLTLVGQVWKRGKTHVSMNELAQAFFQEY